MDKEWLNYWQEIEDLERDSNEDNDYINIDQKECDDHLEKAKDLYRPVLSDDN